MREKYYSLAEKVRLISEISPNEQNERLYSNLNRGSVNAYARKGSEHDRKSSEGMLEKAVSRMVLRLTVNINHFS